MTTAGIVAAAFILIAGLFAVIVERTNERDDARENTRRLLDENAALEAEAQRLHLELTDLLAGNAVHVPLLRVVPPSRESSDFEWPRIARVLEIEDGEGS